MRRDTHGQPRANTRSSRAYCWEAHTQERDLTGFQRATHFLVYAEDCNEKWFYVETFRSFVKSPCGSFRRESIETAAHKSNGSISFTSTKPTWEASKSLWLCAHMIYRPNSLWSIVEKIVSIWNNTEPSSNTVADNLTFLFLWYQVRLTEVDTAVTC